MATYNTVDAPAIGNLVRVMRFENVAAAGGAGVVPTVGQVWPRPK